MNVIIRLQNLPWSANALDIRQFFKGLSIPDGGVHIVGGEMGDAFIAFSTDEDARQAMMHDREAINGVQVRLLLSSRAEMQKVIETARQQSLRALQNSTAAVTVAPPTVVSPAAVAPTITLAAKPQPPVITPNSLHCILSNSITAPTNPSFLAYQQQAGITLISNNPSSQNAIDLEGTISPKQLEHHSNSRERRSRSRSNSRSRDHTSLRRRHDRSREHSKDRDTAGGSRRRSVRSRDRSYDRSRSRSREHSRDRGRERGRNSYHNIRDNKSSAYDLDTSKSKSILSTRISPIRNIYGTLKTAQTSLKDSPLTTCTVSDESNVTPKSLTSINNYSLSSFLSRSSNSLAFALQNPYTAASNSSTSSGSPKTLTTTSSSAIPGIFVEKKSNEISVTSSPSDTAASALLQESIVFADTNPYEKMYPNLFAQAASIGTVGQKPVQNKAVQQLSPVSPREEDTKSRDMDPLRTRCIKIMNMCPGTTYSDIRKFCVGLYIPHNGIKMVNDSHGLRVGVAYIQFSKYTCVARAMSRNNHLLRNKTVLIEAVSEDEFEAITDSFHPDNRDKAYGNRGDYNSDASDGHNFSSNAFKHQPVMEPFNVLYIEDIPSLTTEQDIMKMFSSYSLYDILLIASPENRREFVAHVRFSREEDALLAFEDKAHHQIGYRRLRVRPGSLEEMDRAKEKIRLANEQLMKEEQEAEEENRRKVEAEEQAAKAKEQKHIVSLDLTQSDGEGGDGIDDAEDFIDSTNTMIDNVFKNEDSGNYEDRYDYYKGMQNNASNEDRNGNGRPSSNALDVDYSDSLPTLKVNDPRLRKTHRGVPPNNGQNNQMSNIPLNNFNNFGPDFNDQQISPSNVNSTEHNFVILKNCDYNTRINDVAQLLITANLALKHIEPLHNERQLPTGEFIVEFRRPHDTEVAVKQFHNIQFMNRSLRVFPITPQEIADRLGKPFLGYIPGGNGIKVSGLKTLAAAMNVGGANNMEYGSGINNNNNSYAPRGGVCSGNRFDQENADNFNMNDDNIDNGLSGRFLRPGCVLELENVPYKAQLSDILNFFQGFDLKPEDIIRRFNDNGQPTGDARVAFETAEDARKALEARRRKQIFNRTIYMNIL